ncbi:MAG: methyl-accepting chemotaxis protein [Desulfovibrio sp.]|jgi:methyl-accepting chemotaxis protein|nr:methyl-accepting chemotaxis protein [Desulfovibrio sp.]
MRLETAAPRHGFRFPLSARIQVPVCLLVVLLVAACGLLSFREAAESMRHRIEESSLAAAESVSRAMDVHIAVRRSDVARIAADDHLESFAEAWMLTPPGDEESEARARESMARAAKGLGALLEGQIKKYFGIDTITVIGMNGIAIASSNPAAVGVKFGDRDYVKAAMKGEVVTSRPIRSRVNGKAVLVVAAPVEVMGRIVGVVYTAGSLDAFHVREMKPFGRTGVQFATDMDGLLVMHDDPNYLFKELPSTPIFKAMVAAPPSGVAEYRSAAGTEVFGAYHVDPVSGMMFVLQSDVSEIFASLADIRRTILAGCGVAALVGLLAVQVLLRPVLTALRRAIGYAGDIAAGNLDGDLHIDRRDEIGDLAVAMKSIPDTVKGIVSAADRASDAIGRGEFGYRLDAGAFPGSFSRLAERVNVIADAYCGVIDDFPPLMSCDAGHRVVYANRAALGIMGGGSSKGGSACADRIRMPLCGTSGCPGDICMREKRPASGETVIEGAGAEGRPMDVAVTAVPCIDGDGAVRGFFEFLQDLGGIRDQQRTIEALVEKSFGISKTLAESASELDVKVVDVAKAAEEQRTRIESAASAMAQINASISEVASRAAGASERCGRSKDKAEEGAGIVRQAISAIESVNGVTASLMADMEKLGSQTEGIGGVLSVITDIADQTNLLALNAAIEAARAGEAGRGFAVVADEVRKLADRTASATHEVEVAMSVIQRSARDNSEAMVEAARRVGEAVALADRSGDALREIVEISSESAHDVSSIAASAEEQGASADEMAKSLEEIRMLVAGTAEGMSAAAKGVETLKGTAERLRGVVENAIGVDAGKA